VPHVLSKSEFAASVGVSPSRLSHWLREGRIDGAAVIGSGYKARIDADLARRQLDSRLDLSQRLGANGKALGAVSDHQSDEELDTALAPGATLDTGIKSARLRQLELANERAAAEVAAGSGRYVEAEAAKLEMGRIAGRMVAAFDGVLPDLADAVAAASALSQRDALHLLRGAWLASRSRLAGPAQTGPETVEARP
jgi:DNA-binding transcriptional MerR regulator